MAIELKLTDEEYEHIVCCVANQQDAYNRDAGLSQAHADLAERFKPLLEQLYEHFKPGEWKSESDIPATPVTAS